MCRCTPEIRTPWCGKQGCERPVQVMPWKAHEINKTFVCENCGMIPEDLDFDKGCKQAKAKEPIMCDRCGGIVPELIDIGCMCARTKGGRERSCFLCEQCERIVDWDKLHKYYS